MPIWLRKFYVKQIEAVVAEQNKEHKKHAQKNKGKSTAKPGITPRK